MITIYVPARGRLFVACLIEKTTFLRLNGLRNDYDAADATTTVMEKPVVVDSSVAIALEFHVMVIGPSPAMNKNRSRVAVPLFSWLTADYRTK